MKRFLEFLNGKTEESTASPDKVEAPAVSTTSPKRKARMKQKKTFPEAEQMPVQEPIDTKESLIYLAVTRGRNRVVFSGSFELYAEFMQASTPALSYKIKEKTKEIMALAEQADEETLSSVLEMLKAHHKNADNTNHE